MPNNAVQKINTALAALSKERDIASGVAVANALLEHAGISIQDNVEEVLLTALKLPNAERYDHWFQAHPKFKSNRACFAINDIKTSALEAKLYALKKKSRLNISGAVHFTPNFEDALFTRQDPNAKVGIDFFLPPDNDAVMLVVSNNKSLRVVELKDRLTNTQIDIFAKWNNVATLDREQLHFTIWESFKLKSINEAFYKGIANSFKDLVSHLESQGKDSNEARHFANRLHGRLLFCWFLDKKGFINHDPNYFNLTHTDASAYYKEKLELLFFDTLNTPQGDREKSHPDQKTPYLNGGLFEAQPDDWRDETLSFPAGFFVRLYEHFGEFNFTTDESTPDYEQIAIDPEMLGKIFENLLAEISEDTGEQARKAKGAFYTPREIVAYMCRESVREYLNTATKAGEKGKVSIDKLLDTSDSDWAKAGTNSKRDAVEPELREKIVKALDEMKVLDPACGSGAFPIGMLHMLVQLYERLDSRFDPYKTKLGIMERNIYGVDIEPLAIEISRLRSFLALVVDQEYVDKKPNGGIDTLPNLEFKFVCANSLISLTEQSSLGDGGKYESLLKIKQDYFKATPKQREFLETKYSTLRQQGTMFDSKLNEQLQTYDPFNNNYPASFYDQHLMHDITEAFDVLIGNPPYGGKKIGDDLQKNMGLGSKDMYGAFITRSIHSSNSLLHENGILSFIVSDTFMTLKSHKQLREKLLKYKLNKVIRLHPDTFKATVNTAVIFLQKQAPASDHLCEMSDLTNLSVHDDYDDFIRVLSETKKSERFDISNDIYGIYYYAQTLISTNSNKPFFVGSSKIFQLLNDTSSERKLSDKKIPVRSLTFNGKNINFVKFGDVAMVCQGLATGYNKDYLFQISTARGSYRSIDAFSNFILKPEEIEKISKDPTLRTKATTFGFHKNKTEENFDSDLWFDGRYILPYDKGGAGDIESGWLPNYNVPTEYFIDWSTESINKMKSLTIKERNRIEKKAGGSDNLCAVIRNPETYFREGLTFSWTGFYAPTYRLAAIGPYDHGSSDIFLDEYNKYYILGLLCSKLCKYLARNVVNHTVNFGVDDVKEIFIPATEVIEITDAVKAITKKQALDVRYDYMLNEQKKIDSLVYKAYGLDTNDIQEVEKWFARRYPKLRKWCYIEPTEQDIKSKAN